MANPNPYTPSYSFSDWQSSNPAKPLPAPQLDNELANISSSLNFTITALADVRRSDGKLKNGVVTVDSLSPGLTLGFTLKGTWLLGAHYVLGDGVFYGGKCYRCQVVNDATNLNRPDIDATTWVFLYSTTDLAGAMSIATYDPTGVGANVFARANHTGTQAISTVSGLQAAIDALNTGKLDLADGVRYDVAQPNTAARQAQARANISAALKGHLFGLVLSNNATDAANDVDISAGEAASGESDPVLMVLSSVLTKRIDAAWAVGNNQGGLDTGVVGNNVYYLWFIERSDTGVRDALFSLSKTAPTMPAGYDRKRLVGSFARVAGANCFPRSYSQREPTPWVAYPSSVANLGTVSAATFRSRRNGDCIEVMFNFTSGTAVGAVAAFTLGANGVNGNIFIDAGSGSFGRMVGGPVATNIPFAASLYIIGSHAAGDVNFGVQNAGNGGLNTVNGSAIGSSTTIAGIFSFPIQGWGL